MEKNLFEIASRRKYRFASRVGEIYTEDLWDLGLESLDGIYQKLEKEFQETTNKKSLLSESSEADERLSNMIDIIKHVVKTKQEERQYVLNEKSKSEEKQRLLSLLNDIDSAEEKKLTREQVLEKLGNL